MGEKGESSVSSAMDEIVQIVDDVMETDNIPPTFHPTPVNQKWNPSRKTVKSHLKTGWSRTW